MISSSYVRPLRSLGRYYSTKIWSDFSKRSETLKLIDPKYEKDLLQGINPEQGPNSLVQPDRRLAYHSPVAIDETFKLAYEYLEGESAKIYAKIDEKKSVEEVDRLLVKAEQYNPEVLFNIENSPTQIDRDQPVYRKYLQEKWESHDRMLSMQRLEQLHVIPDTMPTLDPKAEVKVKFPHNTVSEFSEWVEPGTILPAFAVNKPPTIQIQEFERVPENLLYTVLLVNPDTPDLETNTFKTTLQYALTNVPLSNSNNVVGTAKLLDENFAKQHVAKEYEPLVPEKNAQLQRACLWVFRQLSGEIKATIGEEDNFDIRKFAESNSLKPIGAHVWRQQFDRSVNQVRKEYGLPNGRVFHRVRKAHPVIPAGTSNVV